MVFDGQYLYGTISSAWGIFRMRPDGSEYTVIASSLPGGVPNGELVLSGGTLYGIQTPSFSTLEGGRIFRINTDGTGYGVVKETANFT